MPEELCPICDGAGLRVIERADGTRAAVPCECRVALRSARMIQQARIPQRYAKCTFDSYDTKGSVDRSLKAALIQARSFVNTYPLETDGKGLLFIGSIGVGKTHLAVATLRALIVERGAKGLFYDYRDLLKELQNSYERKRHQSEREILAPVFDADVLVLDEIGAAKASDWAGDTITHIVNTRYNDSKSTIVTTNLANLPPGAPATRDNFAAPQQETLGDRIGERMRSRLQEMCVVIEMMGEDRRQKDKRARFGNDSNEGSGISPEATILNVRNRQTREDLAKQSEDRIFREKYGGNVGGEAKKSVREDEAGVSTQEDLGGMTGARSVARYVKK
jgi:DNA replication protein DnaC